MKLHILGICGTFMAGIAKLSKELGCVVEGSDEHIYPPMNHFLEELGIKLHLGYHPAPLKDADLIIVGNVIKRGNKAIEYVLDHKLPYLSGPEWLYQQVLKNKKVIAIAGTHGKTTTTSLISHLMDSLSEKVGFLIGGIPENFGQSARLGQSDYFVIEADEYDTAFFDKRAKFIHYRPDILIINNIEYDHADIYPSLDSIQQQFHYLIRTIPSNGCIIYNANDQNILNVLSRGYFSKTSTFNHHDADFSAKLIKQDGSRFIIEYRNQPLLEVDWGLIGKHNVSNALASVACLHELGFDSKNLAESFKQFRNVKRRLELKGSFNHIYIYDDFAHHPTAIETTLSGLRNKIGNDARIIAVLEFGSYTMRSGVHNNQLPRSLENADIIIAKKADARWDCDEVFKQKELFFSFNDIDELVKALVPKLRAEDHVVVMSNKGFEGVHEKLIKALSLG